MESETERIIDQLQRAYSGDAWHGPSLADLIADVDANRALRRPIAGAHNIWELVLHLTSWINAAAATVRGGRMPEMPWQENWPSLSEPTEQGWSAAKRRLDEVHDRLVSAAGGLTDEQLSATVPGRQYSTYVLLHGVVQHNLYHAGQIALLKKG